jgi:hypothetical protein
MVRGASITGAAAMSIRLESKPLRRLAVALATALVVAGVQAQGVPLSDQELSAVNGQGLLGPGPDLALSLGLNNTTFDSLGVTLDATRITVKADINLNANFRNITLGEYNAGADINIPLLQLGRSDAGDALRLVQLTDPYLEVIYRGAAGAADRHIIGLRLGFGGVAGDLGLQALALSGSLRVDGGADGALDINGHRQDGSGCTAPCLTLANLGGVRAGDATGPSTDLWLAVLKTDVQFPTPAGGVAPNLAQAGFWLNWRDKLTALNVNLPPPPNLPKPPL